MAQPLDIITTIRIGGPTSVDTGLGFHANSVYVENYSNQYVAVPDVQSFVPPYTARLLGLNGASRANILFAAPPGTNQVATIAGQICNATWSEKELPALGGPVGPIGVTSNYYDRNPTDQFLVFSQNNVAPHASVARVTYQTPASRKAFIEFVSLYARRSAVMTAAGIWSVGLNLTASGGAPVSLVYQRTSLNAVNAITAWGATSIGLMQPGDLIQLTTEDLGTGGTVDYTIGFKATEFDA